mmetsp:Transcript_797/g.2170  ORF Transcript_797/g.2170 Transcript_797/m.2170 type:complete len:204 (-) Transcript_797:1212-1823(-)
MPWPIMLNHICFEIIEAVRLTGGRSSSLSEGGSVASASDARESMMRLIQSICTAAIGDSWKTKAPMMAIVSATMLTVSWNCKNLQIDAYTLRPHLAAVTIDAKLSSSSTMSHASLAICVPEMPIAKPTSARLSAGASLVPSPVMATTWRSGKMVMPSWRWSSSHRSLSAKTVERLRPLARVILSSGDDRAITRRYGQMRSKAA